jgi:hypothetical protein
LVIEFKVPHFGGSPGNEIHLRQFIFPGGFQDSRGYHPPIGAASFDLVPRLVHNYPVDVLSGFMKPVEIQFGIYIDNDQQAAKNTDGQSTCVNDGKRIDLFVK